MSTAEACHLFLNIPSQNHFYMYITNTLVQNEEHCNLSDISVAVLNSIHSLNLTLKSDFIVPLL